jgi:hypothetical protein
LNARDADWLLVLDNADDPDLLAAGQGRVHERRGWLRAPCEHGAVLVTTRSANAWGEAALLQVGPLSRDDGAAVLRDLAPDAGPDADALADRLGCLPLALRLAGSYLAAVRSFPAIPGLAAPTTFGEYHHAWEERFVELRDIVRVAERAGRLDHPDILHVRHNYAAAAMDAGELAEAEHVLRAALPVVEARRGDDHLDTVRLRLRLGQVLHRTGDAASAEQLLTTVATALERVHLTESEMARTARHMLALQAFQRGDIATAKNAARDLLAIGRRTAGPQDRLTLETQLLLFTTLHWMGPAPRRTPWHATSCAGPRPRRHHHDGPAAERSLNMSNTGAFDLT